MVASYYSKIELEGKSVLTIIGSGDQIINAYFFGADDVVGFDINQRTLLFFDLKICAIKKLNFREFISFFGTNSANGTFDLALYQKFSADLRPETKALFDDLYENLNGGRMAEADVFRQRSFIEVGAADINAYLKNEDSYQKVKEIIKNKETKLILSDAMDIAGAVGNKKFDVINLSNLPNYLAAAIGVESFLSLLKTLNTLLAANGRIFFYSYSPLNFEEIKIPAASNDDTKRLIADMGLFKMEEFYFPGASKGEDRVLILS